MQRPALPLHDLDALLGAVVDRFALTGAGRGPIRPLGGGLINDTFAVGDGWVLQRLHPIFAAEVNDDIAALVPLLRARGVPVPAIAHSHDGPPYVRIDEPDDPRTGVWRILERLPGSTSPHVGAARRAHDAAALVGRFHAALDGVPHDFAFTRAGAHDTAAHMATLRAAIRDHREHRLFAEVSALHELIEAAWAGLAVPDDLPLRIIHGDLKISNVLFDEQRAVGLIDLDTMAWMDLGAELGDALRSWCNRAGEDEAAALDADVFTAAIAGYAETGSASAAEREAIVPGLLRISLELSARFAADALNERYFGWDPARAPGRGEHNLLRARGQFSLHLAVAQARPTLERAVRSSPW
ncbi:MAG: aminoglycoside phosphotransferase family protein [Deltaproteobacteria bacterium]|nr:aminoglycoside phosphotransferase family protein [Deltaproteobacteria bacterium]